MAFMMMVSRFEKVTVYSNPQFLYLDRRTSSKHWQQSLFPQTPSSILFAYYGHDISKIVYVSLNDYFVMVFTNCRNGCQVRAT